MTITDSPTARLDAGIESFGTDALPADLAGWAPASETFRLVACDLYRDIHKGIRSELFSLVERAGSTDPHEAAAVAALVDHVVATHSLLESHAEHEDGVIQPVLETEMPRMAERIAADHVALDRTVGRIVELAATIQPSGRDLRRAVQVLYLDLARFTSEYLVHIDIEERLLMPALEDAVGPDATFEMHGAIVSSIPPDEMVRSLSLMLPAMNVDDRCELLGGMQAGAPPEVFAGVIDLARSVLDVDDYRDVARRFNLA